MKRQPIEIRKGSVESNEINEQNYISLQHLFQHLSSQSLEEAWEQLNIKYNKQLHDFDLINSCYRSHRIKHMEMYHKFKSYFHPQLIQPQISKFYKNDCFPNLIEIGKWLQNQQSQYPYKYIPPMPKQIKNILDDIYLQQGFIPNLERALLFYPTYLAKHRKLTKILFVDENIPINILYWVGLYTSAEVGSHYIMTRMLKKYIGEGGNMDWINLGNPPQKLKRLQKIIRRACRCPWEISQQLLQEITEPHLWSLKELSFLIEVIAYVANLSTIALAFGLNTQENINCLQMNQIQKYKNQYDQKYYQTSFHQKLSSKAQLLFDNQPDKQIKVSKKVEKKKLKRIENQQNIEGYMKQIGNQLNTQNIYQLACKAMSPFLLPFQYIEKRKQSKYPNLDYSDFNFQTQGYPILSNLCGQSADLILQITKYSFQMTMNNFGQQKKETKKFRKSMQYYSYNLCGYTHLGFPYVEYIKQYLTMPLKYYIRLLTMSPIHISKQVLTQIEFEKQLGSVNCLDMGHVAILIANTKMDFTLVTFLNIVHKLQ